MKKSKRVLSETKNLHTLLTILRLCSDSEAEGLLNYLHQRHDSINFVGKFVLDNRSIYKFRIFTEQQLTPEEEKMLCNDLKNTGVTFYDDKNQLYNF